MPNQWARPFFKVTKPLMTQAMKPPPVNPTILPLAAPINVAIPYVGGQGSTGGVLNCTMGQWWGDPSAYAYAWKSNATGVGTNSANYTVVAGDVGHTITCTVTATNSLGSTIAPTSNGVAIASLAADEASAPIKQKAS